MASSVPENPPGRSVRRHHQEAEPLDQAPLPPVRHTARPSCGAGEAFAVSAVTR